MIMDAAFPPVTSYPLQSTKNLSEASSTAQEDDLQDYQELLRRRTFLSEHNIQKITDFVDSRQKGWNEHFSKQDDAPLVYPLNNKDLPRTLVVLDKNHPIIFLNKFLGSGNGKIVHDGFDCLRSERVAIVKFNAKMTENHSTNETALSLRYNNYRGLVKTYATIPAEPPKTEKDSIPQPCYRRNNTCDLTGSCQHSTEGVALVQYRYAGNLETCRQLTNDELIDVRDDCVLGLARLHRDGYAHGDISRSNIFVTIDSNSAVTVTSQ